MSSVGRFKHSQSYSDKSYKLPIQTIEESSLGTPLFSTGRTPRRLDKRIGKIYSRGQFLTLSLLL